MPIQRWLTVFGLGFGGEGKGNTVDWLCTLTDFDIVVKYSGGPQSTNTVISPTGKMFKFHQFSPGIWHQVPTLLSSKVAIDPVALIEEADDLDEFNDGEFDGDAINWIEVSMEAPLLLPIHGIVARALEAARGLVMRHGNSGVGTGCIYMYAAETGQDYIKVKDIKSLTFTSQLHQLYNWAVQKVGAATIINQIGPNAVQWAQETQAIYSDTLDRLNIAYLGDEEALLSQPRIIAQGSHGILLDQNYGFHPYTTWGSVGPSGARLLIDKHALNPALYSLGVIRTYHTRQGAGPLPSYRALPQWRTAKDYDKDLEAHTGVFRAGDFEMPLFNYAKQVSNVNGVMLTHLDHAEEAQLVHEYKDPLSNLNWAALAHPPQFPNPNHMTALGIKLGSVTTVSAMTVMDFLEKMGSGWGPIVAGSHGRTYQDCKFVGPPSLQSFLGL